MQRQLIHKLPVLFSFLFLFLLLFSVLSYVLCLRYSVFFCSSQSSLTLFSCPSPCSCQTSSDAPAHRLALSPQFGDILTHRSGHQSFTHQPQSVDNTVASPDESDAV